MHMHTHKQTSVHACIDLCPFVLPHPCAGVGHACSSAERQRERDRDRESNKDKGTSYKALLQYLVGTWHGMHKHKGAIDQAKA
jgi:hypothetical protein